MGHIPPGVDIYQTVRKVKNLCSAAGEPEMFMKDDVLAETLARHADVVRLAIFGHTHTDELRLLGKVPVKLVPSISPINGNVAAYTVGKVLSGTGVLEDYSVYMVSGGKDGTPMEWKKEYGFGETFGKSEVTGATVRELIDGFQADKTGGAPASLAFEKSFAVGMPLSPAALVWPEYVCSLANATKAGSRRVCAGPGRRWERGRTSGLVGWRAL